MNTESQSPPPPAGLGNCPHCGSLLPSGVTFCPNCGASITGAHNTPSAWRVLGGVLLGCFGLIVGGFGACLAIIMGSEGGLAHIGIIAVIIACLIVAAACLYGFVQSLRKR